MIEAIVVVLGTLWLLMKYGKTKNPRTLFCAFLVVLLQLSQWPLYLPYAISFGSISLMCAGMIIYTQVNSKVGFWLRQHPKL